MQKLNIFSSTRTKELAQKVVDKINQNHQFDNEIVLGDARIEYFKDNEITCDYQTSIRRQPVYLFGDTGTDNIVEFLVMLDAAKRAAPSEIHIVLPYYGYARQDKKEGKKKRGPIGAKLMADLLSIAAGKKLEGITVVDLHADAIEGFFDVSVNHINGTTIFVNRIKDIIGNDDPSNYLIASPDAGGKQRAKRMAKKLGLETVGMDKTRITPGVVADISLIGDVSGKHIIIVDDLAASCGTILAATDYLIYKKSAASVRAVCTHPVLIGDAVQMVDNNSNLLELIVSDTIPLSESAKNCKKISVASSVDILAKIIGSVLYVGTSMNEINN